jgi:DNA polymerase III epsilon subunit-like protein
MMEAVIFDPLLRGAFERRFVAVDLETTGFTAGEDEIVQLAAVRFIDGVPVESLNFPMATAQPIPEELRVRMGWEPRDPATLTAAREGLKRFESFLGDGAVAWNAEFDLAFLTAAGIDIDRPADGLALERLTDPRGSHRLVYVVARLGLDPVSAVRAVAGTDFVALQAHDALFDAMAAGLVHVRTVEILQATAPDIVAFIGDLVAGETFSDDEDESAPEPRPPSGTAISAASSDASGGCSGSPAAPIASVPGGGFRVGGAPSACRRTLRLRRPPKAPRS